MKLKDPNKKKFKYGIFSAKDKSSDCLEYYKEHKEEIKDYVAQLQNEFNVKLKKFGIFDKRSFKAMYRSWKFMEKTFNINFEGMLYLSIELVKYDDKFTSLILDAKNYAEGVYDYIFFIIV